jgi:hypothetical protein
MRLETLLQVASREFGLQLTFSEGDRVGGGRIAMRAAADEVAASGFPALKGGALHLLGHYLAHGEDALEAARAEEEAGKPHFVALWHALEDARLENAMVRRWPGMHRAFDARHLPIVGGSLLRFAPRARQLELGLYLLGRGQPIENLSDAVRAPLTAMALVIEEGARGDRPEGSLAAMRRIYPQLAGLLRGSPRPGLTRRAPEPDAGSRGGDRQAGSEDYEAPPEIDLGDDLATAGLTGRRREFPQWYRPGSAPWFERGLGEKKIHPSVLRSDAQTIVRPAPGDLRDYFQLWREVQRDVGHLEGRLTNLLREEAYLRFGGQFRSGKLRTAKLWKQRLGIYRLFERPIPGGRSTAFTLLVDESASMKGQEKSRTAAKTAILLGETLDHLNVPLEIIGFTTGDFEARAAMRLGLTPAHEYRTMRCSVLEHRIYKTFGEPYRSVRRRLSDVQPRHNNWDEESLLFAWRRIQARRERARVILVISDGQPNGDAGHLIRAVAELERSGCKIIGLGIGADFVREIYRNSIVVQDFRQMGEELLRLMARELIGAKQARAALAPAVAG